MLANPGTAEQGANQAVNQQRGQERQRDRRSPGDFYPRQEGRRRDLRRGT